MNRSDSLKLLGVAKILVVASLVCPSVFCTGDEDTTRQFQTGTLCDLEDRMTFACSYRRTSFQPRSILECAAVCSTNDLCHGVSLDLNENGGNMCFIHGKCLAVKGCSVPAVGHAYMAKQRCANRGELDIMTDTCACVNSWVGPDCQTRPRDCTDLITYRYPEGDHHVLLDPDQDMSNLVTAICYIIPNTGYYNILVLHHEGNTNFNRTWQEYVQGFYDNSDVWIGLNHWHAMSAHGYNTLFVVLDFGEQGNLYRKYYDFEIRGSSQKFSFSYGSNWDDGRGNVKKAGNSLIDCMGPSQGVNFSTSDQDNDETPTKNCASANGFGWWFDGCQPVCNLFAWGPDHVGSKPANHIASIPGVDWATWLSELKSVTIYIV